MSNAVSPRRSARLMKKRKIDEISADDFTFVFHMPAWVWGSILDFLPYGEVRSALLVGKHIAVEAAKYVRTISLLKPQEMNVPAARRFCGIKKVNVFCLLDGAVGVPFLHDGKITRYMTQLPTASMDAATMAVPFLCSLKKLEWVYFGGLMQLLQHWTVDDQLLVTVSRRIWYSSQALPREGPDNHQIVFKALMTSILGALSTGALPPDL